MNDLTEVLRACETAFSDNPSRGRIERLVTTAEQQKDNPLPIYDLAEQCWRAAYYDLGHHLVKYAFSLPHVTKVALFKRAGEKIRLGDWSGWKDYEARHLRPRGDSPRGLRERQLQWSARRWTDYATDISDETLLIVGEGGFGDYLQTLCFVPGAIDLARRVILMVKPELTDFVQYNFGRDADVISTSTDPTGEYDRYALSFTLPSLFSRIPKFVALRAPQRRERPFARDDSVLRVGICWAGARYKSPTTGDLQPSEKSVPDFSLLEPLLFMANVEWYSLQVGERAGDASSYPCVRAPEPRLNSFLDTASLLVSLDCIVTVDTSVGHLAGRLGVPTLLLLICHPDWRWGFADKIDWYPSLRLIRQRSPNDWSTAITEIRHHLDEFRMSKLNRI